MNVSRIVHSVLPTTLRVRITVVTSLLIVLASSGIGVASYVSIDRLQLSAIDDQLVNTLGAEPLRRLGRQMNRPLEQSDFFNTVAVAVIGQNGSLQLLRPAGVIGEPEPFPTIPSNIDPVNFGQAFTFLDPVTQNPYRAIVRETPQGSRVIALTSLTDYRDSLRHIAMLITFFIFVTALVGGFLTWVIVRRFFRPLDAMISAAGEIAGGATFTRVPEARTGSELGDLALALNAMIESLTNSMEVIESSERKLRNFVSDASHEIRTPLTVIKGYTEILQSPEFDNNPSGKSRALESITRETGRLERLITALLTLDAHRTLNSTEEKFALDELITEHFDDFGTLSNFEVDLSLDKVHINGNSDAWAQLLGNITQNISRYTPAGSRVFVRLRTQEFNPGFAYLTIDDSGPGIPEQSRHEIFGRFTRLEESRSAESGGFGLGMSIVKTVVEAHGGAIELGVSPSGGLRIEIVVPAVLH